MSSCRLLFALIAVAFTVGLSNIQLAGQQPNPGGTIERITVHGRSLEGNLEGDSPDRPVIVYLPPSYAKETARRYPVLYYLHGYTATAEAYAKVLALPASVDRAVAAGVREMIVVLPDAFTKYSGSMYSNRRRSATGRRSSRRICRRSSTSNTAPSRRETAADWPGTRWADTARCEWE